MSALPETIRVKLSSEAADYVSITPVLVQELPLRELVGHMLGVTGKDASRIRELLLRGTLVSGASRFRWTGWDADLDGIRELLTAFPDPEPGRPFHPARCVRATLRTTRQPIEIPREAAARKKLFKKSSFWDVLMEVAQATGLRYEIYSYSDRADIYHATLSVESAARLHQAVGALKYTRLKDQIAAASLEAVDLHVPR
jgi:hypothetical protein